MGHATNPGPALALAVVVRIEGARGGGGWAKLRRFDGAAPEGGEVVRRRIGQSRGAGHSRLALTFGDTSDFR